MAGIRLRSQHVFNLGLLGIEREAVGKAGFRIVKLQRQLIKLVPAVGRIIFASLAKRIHFRI